MAASWYYAIDGEKVGPLKLSEIQQLAATGILKPDDMIWKEGSPNWIPARDANEVQIAFPTASAIVEPVRTSAIRSKRSSSDAVPLFLFSGLAVLVALLLIVVLRPQGKPASTKQPPQQKANLNKAGDIKVAEVNQANVADVNKARLERDGGNVGLPQQKPANEEVFKHLPVIGKINWRRFRHPKGVVEVDMPGEAVLNHYNGIIPLPPGEVASSVPPPAAMNLDHPENYTARSGDLSCSLQVAKLSPATVKGLAANPSKLVDSVNVLGDFHRDRLADESNSRIVSDRPIQLGNSRGREFQIELPQSYVVAQWYMTQTHEFWATIVMPKGRDLTTERGRFFDSLKVTGSSEETPQTAKNGIPSALSNGVPVPTNGLVAEPDDGIPSKIREYFERSERIRSSRIKALETRIAEVRFDISNVRADLKPQKRKELTVLENGHAELKKLQAPIAPLPLPMAVGDIGYHEMLFGISILDDKTISADLYDESRRFAGAIPRGDYEFRIKPEFASEQRLPVGTIDREVIIRGVDTGKISKITPDSYGRRIWFSKVLLRVVSMAPDDELVKLVPERQRQDIKRRVVLEAVTKPAEIEKYREVFNQRKTLKESN